MSEDKRKNARTQGRYSGGDREYSSKKQEKQSSKEPSTDKNKGEKRKAPVVGSRTQNEIELQYDEESNYTFKEFEQKKKPQELKFQEPVKVLSETDNGISKLIYDPDFLMMAEADEYMNKLRATTKWHDKNIVIRGVEYPQPRLVAWYGPHPYTYAGATLEPREMPDTVLKIKEKVEAVLRLNNLNVELNSVLLNWYRDEKDSVAWHSDDELSLGICPTIASVSLGETRRFEMHPKEHVKDLDASSTFYVNLTHGSLIIMDGSMQKDWLHRVPKEFHDKDDRINLTFRTIYAIDQLPPEMPHVPSMKSAKSPNEKVVLQEDPKFDTDNFPPLGMETSDKKSKLLAKENGSKDYQQFASERKSKEHWGPGDRKTKVSPKVGSKSYQQSFVQRKHQREEEQWDDDMIEGVQDSPTKQNNLNKKSSPDAIIDSPELYPSQRDFNSNLKESAKVCNMQFSPSDRIKCEGYSDDFETYQSQSNYESTDSHLFESKNSNLGNSKPVDFNSNVEESTKFCNKQFLPSNFVKSEYESFSSEAYQPHHYEPTNSHLLQSNDPHESERKPIEIKAEPTKMEGGLSESSKKSRLNANAPDFVPQNKFENYSVSELVEHRKQLKNEELPNYRDAILKRIDKNESIFLTRDFYELDVYYKLIEDDSLSEKNLKVILERMASMLKNALFKQHDPRYSNRFQNRSYDDNNHHKHKQSYTRSQRY